MKHRQITEDEINQITKKSPLREKAFFTVMRQSGLPPHTIKQLKIKDLDRILEPDTPIPCKITLPDKKTPTFIGHEAVDYLKQYIEDRTDRPKITQQSLLFTIHNKPNKGINTKDVSRTFRRSAQSLKRPNKTTCKIKRGKPNELTLYSLKKFYQEKAKRYLSQLDNNTPQNHDYHRKLYKKEAMPNLEIEPRTPIQIHQLEQRLAKIEKTVQGTILPVRRLYYELMGLIPEDKDILFEGLKPYIPEKNEQDNQERIQKTFHELVESHKEKDKKALASITTNNHDVPRQRRSSEKSVRKAEHTKSRGG